MEVWKKNGFKIASVEEWKAPRRHTALINYDDPAAVFTERVTLKMSTHAGTSTDLDTGKIC